MGAVGFPEAEGAKFVSLAALGAECPETYFISESAFKIVPQDGIPCDNERQENVLQSQRLLGLEGHDGQVCCAGVLREAGALGRHVSWR